MSPRVTWAVRTPRRTRVWPSVGGGGGAQGSRQPDAPSSTMSSSAAVRAADRAKGDMVAIFPEARSPGLARPNRRGGYQSTSAFLLPNRGDDRESVGCGRQEVGRDARLPAMDRLETLTELQGARGLRLVGISIGGELKRLEELSG